MEIWMLILCVLPAIVTTITISSNGNSPERKMLGGMVIDAQRKPLTDSSKPEVIVSRRKLKDNSSILGINERYRRLIPYMTFYYANDLVTPTTEAQNTKNIEVEKAEIIEAGSMRPHDREPRVIYTSQSLKNIPRYHGNRLTPINIASSYPTKLYYKDVPAPNHNSPKNPGYHALPGYSQGGLNNREIVFDRYVPSQIKAPSTPFTSTRKPYLEFHENAEHSNFQYYSPEQVESQRYKLVPYEQTPPVNVITANKLHSQPAIVSKDPIYIRPRPNIHPQHLVVYDNSYTQQLKIRKPPVTVSEVYYERRPASVPVQPIIEKGFKPIVNSHILTTEAPVYYKSTSKPFLNVIKEQNQDLPIVEPQTLAPDENKYRQEYVIEPVYTSAKPIQYASPDSVSLAELLNSLQINKSIPKPITRENIGASIRTLLQVLSTLNAQSQQNEVEATVLSSPKPFEAPEVLLQSTPAPLVTTTPKQSDFHEEPYLAPIHTPSQHLDEYPSGGGSTQRFPLPVTSDNEGGTPGRPDVDYPILTVIPQTSFDCKTQRYKGFFADTETRCQVWHYCDLNGGQASFLCPNGTIFSQAGLTCDWWFNVRCASTTQLYVLNESLYKYILPHSPKFPEDYSGPLVDKYLTLKFKEMEEQFKKNKNKKVASDKADSDESDETDNSTEETASEEATEPSVHQANVVVESPGSSGNVQRLQDE
ncbi:uncharacterized protein LOC112043642 [Bicyclus anynana]|uniref:Uncharacterized protein LOC112043642 n=1 Tax=Bicyclus anynana TaxID=110368 RepID=A0A6J1MPU4_BICAN|nr:uncharacterized protein LOC112043642 [Bicyclus anynana]